MSKLANMSSTLDNARTILGKKNSIAWNVFEQVNGKKNSTQIAQTLGKQHSNVSYKLGHLEDMGLLTVVTTIGNTTIYQKLPELKKLKFSSITSHASSSGSSSKSSNKSNTLPQYMKLSNITNKVIEIGQTHGISNINQDWIDSLVILNFMETVCSKFLMDHGILEGTVRHLKWEKKFSEMQSILFKEAKAVNFSIRTASISFFKSYNVMRNDQDHIAHLPSSKIHKSDLELLKKNLTLLIRTVFDEHKKYCPYT
ncbi:MAG: helix-turn-helix transcriptional regulator [Thaumarchaeota archaeon]|nr:helix-turn-helix transcriptional regulator [Nitrososphaerota archaeon]